MNRAKTRLVCLFGSLVSSCLVGITIFVLSNGQVVAQEAGAGPAREALHPIRVPHPGVGLWRDARTAVVGTTQVSGVDAGVLIHSGGQDWRSFRADLLVPKSGWILTAVCLLLAVYGLVHGTIRIPGGRTGRTIERNSLNQRIAHWFMAVLFIFLMVTGLVLLYGRELLLDLVGATGLGLIASASKAGHNLFGPLFGFALVWVFALYVRKNLYQRGDIDWLSKGGGFFGGHLSCGEFNAGEKLLFWLTMIFGLAIVGSGLILSFPNFGQDRVLMEQSHVVHSLVAVAFIAMIIGHVFLATQGVEGTFEAISTGKVDENWGRAHHDLWYAEVVGDQRAPQTPPVDRERVADADVSRDS